MTCVMHQVLRNGNEELKKLLHEMQGQVTCDV